MKHGWSTDQRKVIFCFLCSIIDSSEAQFRFVIPNQRETHAMRLTLRTLIAWLDDTLTPVEVKAIGQQVSDSPFAKELIERIHRVTRQRRLTVPNDSGIEGTDPNVVASYLDNQLNGDQVNEFEKRCLTADVNLAEVASVHQILSMIGHKAKVPADAKTRMYRLVRGRETSPRTKSRTARPAAPPRPEAPSHPAVRWSTPSRSKPRVLERFGPILGVLALISLLGYLAFRSSQTESDRQAVAVNRDQPAPGVDANVPKPPVAEPAPPLVVAATDPATPKAEPSKAAELRPEPLAKDDVGSIDAIQGVVLRSPINASAWEPVEAKTPIKPQNRLINLAPFRNLIKTASGEVTLVDSTEVVFDQPEKEGSSQFEIRRGRVVVQPVSGQALTDNVRFEGHMLSITPAPGRSVGVERALAFAPGTAEPAPPRLRIFVPEGKATLKVGDTEEVLEGPAEVSLQVSGSFADKASKPAPPWVLDSAPSAFDKEVASQFGQYLRPGRPILANLVEAMDDPQPKVKEFAASGLGTLGDMESVVIGLDRKDHPAFHRSVVDVLRAGLAQGGDPAKAVRDALARQYDDIWPKTAETLIVGLPSEAARDEPTLARLVEDLATGPSRGIRALALDNLRALTGRDSMEYDPDSPEGKGLRAWQDLVRRKELIKGLAPTLGR